MGPDVLSTYILYMHGTKTKYTEVQEYCTGLFKSMGVSMLINVHDTQTRPKIIWSGGKKMIPNIKADKNESQEHSMNKTQLSGKLIFEIDLPISYKNSTFLTDNNTYAFPFHFK